MVHSSRLSTHITRMTRRFLVHTMTWIPQTQDGDGNYMEGSTPQTEIPCLFLWRDIELNESIGFTTQKTPILYVPTTYNITVDDIISNVVDRDGTVLLVSAQVELVDPTADGGLPVINVCTLSGAVSQ